VATIVMSGSFVTSSGATRGSRVASGVPSSGETVTVSVKSPGTPAAVSGVASSRRSSDGCRVASGCPGREVASTRDGVAVSKTSVVGAGVKVTTAGTSATCSPVAVATAPVTNTCVGRGVTVSVRVTAGVIPVGSAAIAVSSPRATASAVVPSPVSVGNSNRVCPAALRASFVSERTIPNISAKASTPSAAIATVTSLPRSRRIGYLSGTGVASRGKATRKALPTDSRVSTQIRPPCASTSALATLMPTPVSPSP